MKKYVDRDKLQEFTTKLTNKYKTMFSSPLVAGAVEDMIDTEKVYVYVGSETGYTSGNWYYYDGSEWVSGGVYNAVAFETDKTLTLSDQAADSKKVGDLTKQLQREIDTKATAIVQNASGDIVTLENGQDNKPLKALQANIEYDSNGISEFEFRRTGFNIFGGLAFMDACRNITGVTVGQSSVTILASSLSAITTIFNKFKPNTQYTFIFDLRNTVSSNNLTNIAIQYTDSSTYYTMPKTGNTRQTIRFVSAANRTIRRFVIRSESGTTYLYPYSSGIFEGVISLEEFEQYNGVSVSRTFDTIYGGSFDAITGKLISKYAADGTELETPVEYTLVPLDIYTLEGKNNLWYDVTSSLFVEYYIDTTKTINYIYQRQEELPGEISESVKQELNILVVGNSFSQDSFSYLPKILNEILPEYKINYGILYRASTRIGDYYNHPNDTAWDGSNVIYNQWNYGASKWTRYTAQYSLVDVLQMRNWNLIYGQIVGTFSGETWNTTGIEDSKNFVELLKEYCKNFNFVTGSFLARQTNGDLGVHMAPLMSDLCRNAVSFGRFTDFIPIGMAFQNGRTNSTLQALGESSTQNMIYSDDTHMQNGIPALIAAYTIAGKILQWFGFDIRGIYGSTWQPTTENVIAIGTITQADIDSHEPGMTHGASVGMDTVEDIKTNMKIAQNVAIKAILYPDQITDWQAGTAPGNKYDIIAPIYSNKLQYKPGQIAFYNNMLYQCQSITVNDYNTITNYAVGDYVYYNNVIYKCIAATSGTFDSASWAASYLNFDPTKWVKITLADVLEQILAASN